MNLFIIIIIIIIIITITIIVIIIIIIILLLYFKWTAISEFRAKNNGRDKHIQARNCNTCACIFSLSCLSPQFETQFDLCGYTYVNVQYAMIVSNSAVKDSAQPT